MAPVLAGQSRAQALAAGRDRLRGIGIEAADEEARLLLLVACAIDRLALVTGGAQAITQDQATRYGRYLDRRVGGEPASRILGRRPFWTLDLEVRPGVLDPRADSEALVRLALRTIRRSGRPPRKIVDLGCGSGAILCALLSEHESAFGLGVDLSPEACAATRANIAACGLDRRAGVVRGSWCDAVSGPLDLIVSNPPYIPTNEIATLDREVRDHDPALALDGGPDGLDAYRALFAAASRLLGPGAPVVVEFGQGQAGDVAQLAATSGLIKIGDERDLSGRERASAFVVA